MIAADTSSLSAYFRGDAGKDVERLDLVLANGELRLPPLVLTELLSDPGPYNRLYPIVSQFELLALHDGYWERAGNMRRTLKTLGLKAKIADALIAQSCVDHDLPLITRDTDFRHFAKHCGLKLG